MDCPANPGVSPQVYSVTVTALDDIGQPGDASAGQVTVQGQEGPGGGGEDTGPIITSASVDPNHLPADGGIVTITAGAIDDYGIFMAYADIISGDGSSPSSSSRPTSTPTRAPSTSPPTPHSTTRSGE